MLGGCVVQKYLENKTPPPTHDPSTKILDCFCGSCQLICWRAWKYCGFPDFPTEDGSSQGQFQRYSLALTGVLVSSSLDGGEPEPTVAVQWWGAFFLNRRNTCPASKAPLRAGPSEVISFNLDVSSN
jgi:hypothetical protein